MHWQVYAWCMGMLKLIKCRIAQCARGRAIRLHMVLLVSTSLLISYSGSIGIENASELRSNTVVSSLNLAPNCSFERGNGNQPFDWQSWSPTPNSIVQFLWSDEHARTGERSIGICKSITGDNQWANAGWASNGFTATPGVRYTFTAFVKAMHRTGWSHLVIAWFNQDGWIGNSDNGFLLNGSDKWLQLSVTDTAPVTASYGRLYFRCDGADGEAFMDDARLIITVNDERPVVTCVPNGSFEFWSNGSLDAWQITPRNAVSSSEDAYHAQRAVLISGDAGNVVLASTRFCTQSIQQYRYCATAWIRSTDESFGTICIAFQWFTPDGQLINELRAVFSANAPRWRQISVLGAPPLRAVLGRIVISVRNLQGKLLIDNVQLQRVPMNLTIPQNATPLSIVWASCFQALMSVCDENPTQHWHDSAVDMSKPREAIGLLLQHINRILPQQLPDERRMLWAFVDGAERYVERIQWHGKRPARILVERVTCKPNDVTAPMDDIDVTVRVRNDGERPAQFVEAKLTFWLIEQWSDRMRKRDVTTEYLVWNDESNPMRIAPNNTVELHYRIEVFDDTTPGVVKIVPVIKWFDVADNLLCNAGFEKGHDAPPWGWREYVSEPKLNATFNFEVGGNRLQWDGERALRFTIKGNTALGTMTSDSEPVDVQPNAEYVAGIWYMTDKRTLASPLEKALVVIELRDNEATIVREHYKRLWEIFKWLQYPVHFKTDVKTQQVRISLRMTAHEMHQSGCVWWDAVYIVPMKALRTTAGEVMATLHIKQ